ncbi:hypothetical protein R83H12_02919 [Fibrobacteria bacterium R8-3-H12]
MRMLFSMFIAAGALLAIALALSCSNEFEEIDFAEKIRGINYEYCLFKADSICIKGPFAFCPTGGVRGNNCPYEPNSSIDLPDYDYCVFREDGMCFSGPFKACPAGGELSNNCGDYDYRYCVFSEDKVCLEGTYRICPKGGMPSDACPYVSLSSSSGANVRTYNYCVFYEERVCLEGSHTDCPINSEPSNSCPYGSSSSNASSSSESIITESSSSSTEPNSSSSSEHSSSSSEHSSSSSEHSSSSSEHSNSSTEHSSSSSEHSSSSSEPSSSSSEPDDSSSSEFSLCGGKIFDPSTLVICSSNNLYAQCGGEFYNTAVHFCRNNEMHLLCNGKEYDPGSEFCHGGTVEGKCSGKEFEPGQFCINGAIFATCGTNPPYNIATHLCVGNTVAALNPSSSSSNLCGGKAYDPSLLVCSGNSLYDRCGGEFYNMATHFCSDDNKTFPLCSGNEYDPESKFCLGGIIESKCGGKEFGAGQVCLMDAIYATCGTNPPYNAETHFCIGSTVYPKCGGYEYNVAEKGCCAAKEYSKETHFCSGGLFIEPKCGGKEYSPATQQCCNRTTVYNPATQTCTNGAVGSMCGSSPFDPSTEFCSNGKILSLCGGESFIPETQFCSTTNHVETKCGGDPYNTVTQFCDRGSIKDKCDAYDPTYFCNGNNIKEEGLCGYSSETHFCFLGKLYSFCGGRKYNPSEWNCDENGTALFTTFIDRRDTTNIMTYKAVLIGEQVWMAQNLNYKGRPGSDTTWGACYGNDTINCRTYGRMYSWHHAMGSLTESNTDFTYTYNSGKYPGICPSGWHVPRQAEWETLFKAATGESSDFLANAGTYLKAGISDKFGFAALMGGYMLDYMNSYADKDKVGHWWSFESYNTSTNIVSYNLARYYSMSTATAVTTGTFVKNQPKSLRCVKD